MTSFEIGLLAALIVMRNVTSEYLIDLGLVSELTEEARRHPRHPIRAGRAVIGTHPDGHCYKVVSRRGVFDHDLFDGGERPTSIEEMLRLELELRDLLVWSAPAPDAPDTFAVALS